MRAQLPACALRWCAIFLVMGRPRLKETNDDDAPAKNYLFTYGAFRLRWRKVSQGAVVSDVRAYKSTIA